MYSDRGGGQGGGYRSVLCDKACYVTRCAMVNDMMCHVTCMACFVRDDVLYDNVCYVI